jgi:hypothetical protein
MRAYMAELTEHAELERNGYPCDASVGYDGHRLGVRAPSRRLAARVHRKHQASRHVRDERLGTALDDELEPVLDID